ncbi:PepSY domain-containing protein [Bacillus sp. FJAT-42315]|uniref:PepSY domain-containing protein n=1 Tax=Bacillus sp. FJAT-42315 TaxID=2014077 RepID=UPI000C246497|nr:PepSY domain-containing protein [Bacillus sp. FJAT-42315]
MNRKWKVLLIVCFVLVTAAFSVQRIVASMDTKVLTEKEVKQIVTDQYGGEIESIKLTQKGEQTVYHVRLMNDRGTYRVIVHAETGEIVELKEIALAVSEKEAVDLALSVAAGTLKTVTLRDGSVYVVEIETGVNETTIVDIDKATGEVITKRVRKEKPSNVTEQQAKEIAVKQVPGTVVQVTMQSKEDKRFFFVEVKKSEEEHVIVEIAEATGEVLSKKVVAQPQVKISKQQAIEITDDRIDSETISAVKLIETSKGPVYQVIAKTENRIVDVRVHAITGEVMSTTTIDNGAPVKQPSKQPAKQQPSQPATNNSTPSNNQPKPKPTPKPAPVPTDDDDDDVDEADDVDDDDADDDDD